MLDIMHFRKRLGEDISYRTPSDFRMTVTITEENYQVLHGMQTYGFVF